MNNLYTKQIPHLFFNLDLVNYCSLNFLKKFQNMRNVIAQALTASNFATSNMSLKMTNQNQNKINK
jgi:hypothetical protein